MRQEVQVFVPQHEPVTVCQLLLEREVPGARQLPADQALRHREGCSWEPSAGRSPRRWTPKQEIIIALLRALKENSKELECNKGEEQVP